MVRRWRKAADGGAGFNFLSLGKKMEERIRFH